MFTVFLHENVLDYYSFSSYCVMDLTTVYQWSTMSLNDSPRFWKESTTGTLRPHTQRPHPATPPGDPSQWSGPHLLKYTGIKYFIIKINH